MFRLTMNLEFTPLSHVVSVYPIGGNLTVNTSMYIYYCKGIHNRKSFKKL